MRILHNPNKETIMKKLLPMLLLSLPLAAVADPVREIHSQEDLCQSLIQGGAFNFYLERTCGFKGKVSDKTIEVISQQCSDTFDKDQIEAMSDEAIEDGVMRFNRYGKKEFCAANRKGYIDAGKLMDELLQNGI